MLVKLLISLSDKYELEGTAINAVGLEPSVGFLHLKVNLRIYRHARIFKRKLEQLREESERLIVNEILKMVPGQRNFLRVFYTPMSSIHSSRNDSGALSDARNPVRRQVTVLAY
jgi:hypothetical protein